MGRLHDTLRRRGRDIHSLPRHLLWNGRRRYEMETPQLVN